LQPGAFPGLVFADDLFASMFVGGLVGVLIGLLPLRFLPGWTLKEWHRGVWAGMFALASLLVVEVLLLSHPRGVRGHHSPLVVTVLLFMLFGGGSVLFRELFARRRRLAAGQEIHGFRARVTELLTPAPPMATADAPAAPAGQGIPRPAAGE
jgi:hypothetical protein